MAGTVEIEDCTRAGQLVPEGTRKETQEMTKEEMRPENDQSVENPGQRRVGRMMGMKRDKERRPASIGPSSLARHKT